MSSIVLSGDTSGSVTVSAPAVAGTQTVTLPVASGVLQVSGNMPAFFAYSGGSYTAAQGSNSLVTNNTELFDTNGCYNNTGSTVTLNGVSAPAYSFAPNVAGYYQVNFIISGNTATTPTTAYWLPFVYKNGAIYVFGTSYLPAGNNNTPSCTGSCLVYLNGTSDYIQMYVGTNNGGTFTASNTGTTYGPSLSATLVRTA